MSAFQKPAKAIAVSAVMLVKPTRTSLEKAFGRGDTACYIEINFCSIRDQAAEDDFGSGIKVRALPYIAGLPCCASSIENHTRLVAQHRRATSLIVGAQHWGPTERDALPLFPTGFAFRSDLCHPRAVSRYPHRDRGCPSRSSKPSPLSDRAN